MSERKSKAYIATFVPGDPGIQHLRDFMTKCNRMLKDADRSERYYIKLHGRGPRFGNRRWNMTLPLKHAERVDAYIYER